MRRTDRLPSQQAGPPAGPYHPAAQGEFVEFFSVVVCALEPALYRADFQRGGNRVERVFTTRIVFGR